MADERIIRIEDKIDKLGDHLGRIDVTIASQHEVLKEHIRRTQAIEKVIEPHQKIYITGKGVLKICGLIAASVTVAGICLEIIEFIRKI